MGHGEKGSIMGTMITKLRSCAYDISVALIGLSILTQDSTAQEFVAAPPCCTIPQLLDIADKALTVIVLVGGFLAYICRAWIAEWIKHRFSRAVGEELEQQKHKLNR